VDEGKLRERLFLKTNIAVDMSGGRQSESVSHGRTVAVCGGSGTWQL
jgi:hypothetical protein